ncbi:MAG: anthranilate phosphoribosyltransferase [Pyrinomonadaceae bacterium]
MNSLDSGSSTLSSALSRLMRGEHLSLRQAAELLETILASSTTDAQIAAVLTALSIKGETAEELAGMAATMREFSVRIRSKHRTFIDTAGTGSSHVKSFNVSTASAFVIAGAGLPVAKHGARAATSQSGSADVLIELGLNINAPVEIMERALNEIGICFMFAPLYHTATARVARVRRELGMRTIFNLLGPLTNPAGAPRQLLGVSRSATAELMARALRELGTERTWIVHGIDGLDEVSISDQTLVWEVNDGQVRNFEIAPEDFQMARESTEHLRSGNAATNAQIIHEVLSGTRRDVARSLVLLNAAAALYVGGSASALSSLESTRIMAEESIDNGSALSKLKQLIEMTKPSIAPAAEARSS